LDERIGHELGGVGPCAWWNSLFDESNRSGTSAGRWLFYHLVQRFIKADIPIIFLAFPRLTYDADYLFDKLRPVLPLTVDHQMACSAHQSIADPAKVRIGSEIESEI
jgi:hypothetical protein